MGGRTKRKVVSTQRTFFFFFFFFFYTSQLTSNLVDRGRTKSPMCDHLPTDDANLGHRREREVVRERHHDVARVLREALDARQEGDRARHGGGREHAHDADHRRAAVEDLALEAALLLLGGALRREVKGVPPC